MATINQSVGVGGKNRYEDVLVVQFLLNKFIVPGLLAGPILTPDGKIGPKTRQTIKAFQAVYLGFKAPDGRVDPGGKTIGALNGPVTQPKLGDPHESAVQSVVSTLRSTVIQCLRFQMSGYSVTPDDYRNLAEQFAWRRLQVYYMSAMGENAEYVHGNDTGSGGHMLVGFPTATTPYRKSVVVHEATHAVCDGWGQMMGVVQGEALAYLAQGIYYHHLTGHGFSLTFAPTADVLTTAVNIAIRMKSSGNRTVLPAEVSELYGRVMKVPGTNSHKVFAYDGH